VSYNNPTTDDFKTRFARDFPFGTTSDKVMESDLMIAFNQTDITINQGLFSSQGAFNEGFLLLAAHNLVMNLRASSQGISGQYPWLQQSRSVGSVSESVAIPQRILENPIFAMLAKTNYGAKYLEMILPQLVGQVFTVAGATQAL